MTNQPGRVENQDSSTRDIAIEAVTLIRSHIHDSEASAERDTYRFEELRDRIDSIANKQVTILLGMLIATVTIVVAIAGHYIISKPG